jgi:hypothetical protein
LARLRARGETIATSAKLAGVSEREVSAYLKAVPRTSGGHGRERGRWRVVGRGGLKAVEMSPVIGFDNASAIAHDADRTRRTLRESALDSGAITAEDSDRIVNPATMVGPF